MYQSLSDLDFLTLSFVSFFIFSVPPQQAYQSVSKSVNYFSTFSLRLAFRPAPLMADLALLACVGEWIALIADD